MRVERGSRTVSGTVVAIALAVVQRMSRRLAEPMTRLAEAAERLLSNPVIEDVVSVRAATDDTKDPDQ